MYGAKGTSFLHNIARQGGFSKQWAAAHGTTKSTAFLSNISGRNVSPAKLSYTTSRASAHLNKQSQQDDDNTTTTPMRPLPVLQPTVRHLVRISRIPPARFNHTLAAQQKLVLSDSNNDAAAQEQATGDINARILEAARTKDPETVVAEFLAGRTNGARMSTQSYDAVLDAYGSMHRAKSYNNSTSSVVHKDKHPVTPMLKVYEDMLENDVRPTSHSYALLIKSLCMRNAEVHRTINMLRRRGNRFGTKEHKLSDLESESNMEQAVALFERAVKEQQTEEFDVKLYNTLLYNLTTMGQTKDALYIYEQLEKAKHVNPDATTFSLLITLFGNAGDLAAVRECFQEYKAVCKDLPKHDSAPVYNALVTAHVEFGDIEKALDIVENLMVRDGVKVTITPYNRIITHAAQNNNVEFVERLVRKLEQTESLPKPNARTYGAMLSMYCRLNDGEKASEVYKRLVQLDVSKEYGGFADYVCFFRSHKMPDRALEIAMDMKKYGFFLDQNMMRQVVYAFVDVNDFKKAEETYKLMTNQYAQELFITTDSPVGQLAMDLARDSKDLSVAVSVTNFIAAYGVPLSTPAAEAIVDFYRAAKQNEDQWKRFAQDASSRTFATLTDAVIKATKSHEEFTSLIFDILHDLKSLDIIPNQSFYGRVAAKFQRKGDVEALKKWNEDSETLRVKTENQGKYDTTSTIESVDGSSDLMVKASQDDFDGVLDVLNNNIIQRGKLPTAPALNNVMQRALRTGRFDAVRKIYDLVEGPISRVSDADWKYRMQHKLYNNMLLLFAREHDVARANEFHEKMRQQHMVPQGDAYGALIACVSDATVDDNPTDTLKIYEEAKANRVRPTVYFYNVVLSKLAKFRKIDLVLKIFDEMKQNNIKPNSITYAALISACTRCTAESRAERFFQDMISSPGYVPRIGPFNNMIQFYVQQRPNRDKALEYYHLSQQYHLKPTAHTYRLLMELYANIPPYDMPTAHRFLTEMSKRHGLQPGPEHYATLIQSYGCLHRDVASAVACYNELRKTEIKVDRTVYQAMLSTYIENNDMPAAENLYQEMINSGTSSWAYIENLLITGYGAQGNLAKVEEVWERMTDKKDGPLDMVREPSTYEAMVKAYLANDQPEKAAKIVEHMKTCRDFPQRVVDGVASLL